MISRRSLLQFFGISSLFGFIQQVQTKETMPSRAYNEGIQAYKDGKAFTDNPYPLYVVTEPFPHTSPLHHEWARGWQDHLWVRKQRCYIRAPFLYRKDGEWSEPEALLIDVEWKRDGKKRVREALVWIDEENAVFEGFFTEQINGVRLFWGEVKLVNTIWDFGSNIMELQKTDRSVVKTHVHREIKYRVG